MHRAAGEQGGGVKVVILVHAMHANTFLLSSNNVPVWHFPHVIHLFHQRTIEKSHSLEDCHWVIEISNYSLFRLLYLRFNLANNCLTIFTLDYLWWLMLVYSLILLFTLFLAQICYPFPDLDLEQLQWRPCHWPASAKKNSKVAKEKESQQKRGHSEQWYKAPFSNFPPISYPKFETSPFVLSSQLLKKNEASNPTQGGIQKL